MKRKQKPIKGSKYGVDAHRRCKNTRKRMTERFLDENEELFERYKRGEIY